MAPSVGACGGVQPAGGGLCGAGRVGGGIGAGHGGASPRGPSSGRGGTGRVPAFATPARLVPVGWRRPRPSSGALSCLPAAPGHSPPQGSEAGSAQAAVSTSPDAWTLWAAGSGGGGGVRPRSPSLPSDLAHAPAPLRASVSPSTKTGCRVRCAQPGFRAGRRGRPPPLSRPCEAQLTPGKGSPPA